MLVNVYQSTQTKIVYMYMLHMFGHSNQITVQAPEQTTIATYLESNLKHQGLDSIQFQCT